MSSAQTTSLSARLAPLWPDIVPQLGGATTTRRLLADDQRLLVDALSPRSTYFHHAVRVAIAVLVAQLVGRWLSPAHV